MQNIMWMFKASMFTTKIGLLRFLFLFAYFIPHCAVKCDENMINFILSFNIFSLVIQPFWRIWNAAGSDGRGVIGIVFNWKV